MLQLIEMFNQAVVDNIRAIQQRLALALRQAGEEPTNLSSTTFDLTRSVEEEEALAKSKPRPHSATRRRPGSRIAAKPLEPATVSEETVSEAAVDGAETSSVNLPTPPRSPDNASTSSSGSVPHPIVSRAELRMSAFEPHSNSPTHSRPVSVASTASDTLSPSVREKTLTSPGRKMPVNKASQATISARDDADDFVSAAGSSPEGAGKDSDEEIYSDFSTSSRTSVGETRVRAAKRVNRPHGGSAGSSNSTTGGKELDARKSDASSMRSASWASSESTRVDVGSAAPGHQPAGLVEPAKVSPRQSTTASPLPRSRRAWV
jgi:hypothetical protein